MRNMWMGRLRKGRWDPQDGTFYRYEVLQPRRTNSFSHAEKGFAFDMNEFKNLLD